MAVNLFRRIKVVWVEGQRRRTTQIRASSERRKGVKRNAATLTMFVALAAACAVRRPAAQAPECSSTSGITMETVKGPLLIRRG
jgi:hypothetical protein